ncbi:MAG: DUF3108 domain-containing protein [Hydrogenophaga sp.]|nr:DUF3108 domain-containing protein [Hydrogenophaga sp.]
MATSVSRSAHWRLAALAGAVLAAHAWLLASPLLPAADVALPLNAPRALQTRTVVLAPKPAVATSPAPAAPRAPARVARPRTQPSTAPASLVPITPMPAPVPVPAPEPEEPVADVAPPEAPAVEVVAAAPVVEDVVAALAGDKPAAEPAAVPFAPPPSARLHYEVHVEYRGVRQNLNGTLDWQHDGERYRLHMAVEMVFLGSRVQHSEGRLGRHGIHPQRFSEKTRSERAAHFDEASTRIRYSANTPDAPLLPGHQDRLSVFLQLAGLVHARPERFPAGHTVHIPTSGVRDSETWAFEVKGTETIALPKGDVAALHLRRLPRKEFDTTVDVWLAPALGHLPVRMRLQEANGNVADQRLITP